MKPRRMLTIKNFRTFQHYKDRNPPWIKLYTALLEDYDFLALSDAARSQLMLIWLLASRTDGCVPNDPRWIATAIHATGPVRLEKFIEAGFLVPVEEGLGNIPSTRAGWASRYISAEVRTAVLERDGNRCVVCGVTEQLEIDHIVPVSRGGTGAIENLQTLCRRCNRRKRSTMPDAEQVATQTSASGVASAEPGTTRATREETETETETHPPPRAKPRTAQDARHAELLQLIPNNRHADLETALAECDRVAAMAAELLGFASDADGTGRTYTGAQIGSALHDWVANGDHRRFNARQLRRYVEGAVSPPKPNGNGHASASPLATEAERAFQDALALIRDTPGGWRQITADTLASLPPPVRAGIRAADGVRALADADEFTLRAKRKLFTAAYLSCQLKPA